jgi:hypothetical protein
MRLRPRGGGRVHVRLVRRIVQSLYRTLLGGRLPSQRLSLRGILPKDLYMRGGKNEVRWGASWGGGALHFESWRRDWTTLLLLRVSFPLLRMVSHPTGTRRRLVAYIDDDDDEDDANVNPKQ